jgi:hypothetical protein
MLSSKQPSTTKTRSNHQQQQQQQQTMPAATSLSHDADAADGVDAAAVVTFAELVDAMQFIQLHRLFRAIDTSDAGVLQPAELCRFALQECRLSLNLDTARDLLLSNSSTSSNNNLDFGQFHSLLRRRAAVDVHRLSQLWLTGSLGTAETLLLPLLILREDDDDGSIVGRFISNGNARLLVAGGTGAMVALTLTAPIERASLLAHTAASSSLSSSSSSMRSLLARIVRDDGWRGLLHGNGANCARAFVFGGVVCATYAAVLHLVGDNTRAVYDKRRTKQQQQQQQQSSDDDDEADDNTRRRRRRTTKRRPADLAMYDAPTRIVAGAVAATVATLVAYPFDVAKLRLSVWQRSHSGILATWRHMYRHEGGGLRATLFKGLRPALLAAVPFVAIQQTSYDLLKTFAIEHGREHSVGTMLLCGGAAGMLAQLAVHPMHVLRRRLQMSTQPMVKRFKSSLPWRSNGTKRRQQQPRLHVHNSTWRNLRMLTRRGGIRALYRGLPAALLKVVPTMAVSLFVRDTLIDAEHWSVYHMFA